ncbi:regulation of nuclear pre-mRNA domain-containing protein 1B [Sitophilus oryzae]|uniref:Regulation of nuclear pre-mRNA domain-containing protein 1B n=1 Tax=Sitophilus oryzae TaxID=7048 RepID=A0A6J2XN27_SITOR|nr:regulation of nuclear pre-mRNA domain-containing protein 1B [Sitophilus oryzae]
MSGGFTESAFIKKLQELNNSSQSIQTLSLWLIHHRKHYSSVVKIWLRELQKAKDSRKLTFMYLANDVIQNSRKKGPEYGQEFGTLLKKAFEHMSACDEKTRNSLDRLLSIWQDRGIYVSVQIMEFKSALLLGKDEPPLKKIKPNDVGKKRDKEVTVEVDGTLETHVHLSPHTPPGDPPEPEELIKAIQDLEVNIASSDEKVREKIAHLPKEVSDVAIISKIEDREAAEKLSNQVNSAVLLLSQYNTRLQTEMEHRKKVAVMMRDFLQVQDELLAQAERNLEEYQETLSKIYSVRQELQSHIQNLPDLTQLPNVTDGLAPLPSAENLFMQ